MTQSREQVNVAMLHPIRSSYFDYKRETAGFSLGQQDAQLQQDCRLLSKNCVGYHFLDETLLEKHGFVEGNQIGCGQCSYDYLILPHILTMDVSTEKLLRKYVENGGKLLILGEVPSYLEGEPHSYDYLRSNCTFSEILKAQPVAIGSTDHSLYCSYRMWEDTPVLVVQNADGMKAHTQSFSFGEHIRSFVKLDLQTMKMSQVPLTVKLEAGETLVLFPSRQRIKKTQPKKEAIFALQNAAVSFTDNYLTLDMVRYSYDGQEFSHVYPCRGLFQKLLWERYEGPLYLKYEFAVRERPNRIEILTETGSMGEQWLNGSPLQLSPKGKAVDHAWQADITELIRVGKNDYTVKIHWHQNEQVYYALFGENVTESLKNCIVYDSELEAIYLKGDFGVYSDTPAIDDGEYAFMEDFYIAAAPQKVTEPTYEGLPFFRGMLSVSQTVEFSESVTHLRVGGTYQSATVFINGKMAGKLLLDRVVEIKDYIQPGENLVQIDFVISNRNLLGPHHHIDKTARHAVSPYLWELTNEWVKDEKTGYRSSYELLKLFAD